MIFTYKVVSNGYIIYLNELKYIQQIEPYIPDKTKTYKENAENQIKELILSFIIELEEQLHFKNRREI